MIQSEPKPNPSVPVPAKQTFENSPKGTAFNAGTPEKPSSKKGPMIVLLAVLFVAAIGGGLLAYQNFSKTNTVDLTEKENLLAWRPYSVRGTCSGIKVIGEVEKVPYTFAFTFVLSEGTRTGTLTHSFDSKPVTNGHKIDEDISWASLGAAGAQFGSQLKTNDTVSWTVEVTYVLNGTQQKENYADSFKIFDAACSTQLSPSPSPTQTASSSPSPSATGTVRPSPTATVTASPSPTASPTEPPVGGPSNTPTPSPTASPTASPSPVPSTTTTAQPTSSPAPSSTTTTTTTTQSTNPPTQVAAQTGELPKAGIPYGVLFMGIGFVSLAVSAGLTIAKKKF